jgi:hypothetical protein
MEERVLASLKLHMAVVSKVLWHVYWGFMFSTLKSQYAERFFSTSFHSGSKAPSFFSSYSVIFLPVAEPVFWNFSTILYDTTSLHSTSALGSAAQVRFCAYWNWVLSIHVVKFICLNMGVQLKSKLWHARTWFATASFYHLYQLAVFIYHFHLITL